MSEATKAIQGLAIRFDGPPEHKAGRFVEVEIDGRSVNVGKWVQQGSDWLLVLGPEYAAAPEMFKALKDAELSITAMMGRDGIRPETMEEKNSALRTVREALAKAEPEEPSHGCCGKGPYVG